MFDLHYDMLSVLYKNNLDGDFSYTENTMNWFRSDNIRGIFANLYFMSIEEMSQELKIDFTKEKIDVVEMFRISTRLSQKYYPSLKIIYSIEGADYIEINQLEELYQLGLRSILLVWNHKNKYASGTYALGGLTKEGEKFLEKAVDLGIVLDLSHANEESFFGMIEFIKKLREKGKHPLVMASHSNSYLLTNHPRNLTDEQLRALKDVGAIVGVVSNIPFLKKEEKNKEILKKIYLEHIKHIVSIMGIDSVSLSTDNMEFVKSFGDDTYDGCNLYCYDRLKEEVVDTLKEAFDEEEIRALLYQNVEEKIVKHLERRK